MFLFFILATEINVNIYVYSVIISFCRINIWDAEKERLVLLTNKSLLVIKFDFIALRPLEVRRTLLEQIDTLVLGDLVYPPASLVP